jgi:hypothetical protein
VYAETTLELGPLGHEGLFVNQLFPNVPAVQAKDFQGRLEIETYAPDFGETILAPVTGLTLLLRSSASATYLTSAPLAPFVVNFGPSTSFSPATLLAGAEPSFCINSRQLPGEIPFRRALITVDSASIDFSMVQDSEIFGKSFSTLLVYRIAGNSFPTDTTADSSLFFAPITFDGVSEGNPFLGSVTNLPQGGIEFEILNDVIAEGQPVEIPSLIQICFDAGLLQLPDKVGTELWITEHYESDVDPELDGAVPLESTRFAMLSTVGVATGAPRIRSMDALQVAGGQEVVLNGSFTGGVAGNRVTVEGNSRVEAEVTSATSSRLSVRLPNNVASGPLRVEASGKTSNDYELDVLFAPWSEVDFSGSSGSNATLRLEVNQHRDELPFAEVELRPSQGEWITSGFSVGENIGSLVVSSVGQDTVLELRVKISDANGLLLDAVESGDDDPVFEIEAFNAGNKPLVLRQINAFGFPSVTQADVQATLQTDRPIFRRPAGSFGVNVVSTSQPERATFLTTAVTVQEEHTF